MNIWQFTFVCLSMLACFLVLLLGILSPLYKVFPNKIQVWIALSLFFIYLLSFFDDESKMLLLKYFATLCYFSLNVIFLFELKNTLQNPFCSNKSKNILYGIIFLCFILQSTLFIIDLYIYGYDQTRLQELKQNIIAYYTRGIYTAIFFLFYFTYSINRASKLENSQTHELKKSYFKRQAIWFLIVCVIEIISISLPNETATMLAAFIGLIFGLFQLTQKYAITKIKCFFLRCWTDVETLNLIQQIESGSLEDPNYTPAIIRLKNAQIIELVKGILSSVERLLIQEWPLVQFQERKRTYQILVKVNSSFTSEGYTSVRIKTHYPDQFLQQLKYDGYNPQIIQQSLDIAFNQLSLKKTQESMGKSGAFFFFSENKKFILKTMTKDELKSLLRRRIQKYFNHLQNNPQTVLAKIYGLFKVKLVAFKPVYLILMENTFEQIQYISQPSRVYDLKGSLQNRNSKKDAQVQKDLNFLSSKDCPIQLFETDCRILLEQINKDVELLKELQYMDYSFLVGIVDADNNIECQIQSKYPRLMKYGSKYYSFSIIDYLQEYNCNKKMESSVKSMRIEKYQISCVPPQLYYERFLDFVNKNIVHQ